MLGKVKRGFTVKEIKILESNHDGGGYDLIFNGTHITSQLVRDEALGSLASCLFGDGPLFNPVTLEEERAYRAKRIDNQTDGEVIF